MKRSHRNTLFAVVMGAVLSLSAATMATAQSSTQSSFARAVVQADESNDGAKNGEDWYKMGCSLAASLDIPSCGELPSGRQFLAQPEVSFPDVSTEDDATSEDDNDADDQDEVDQYLQAQQEAAQNLIDAIQHPVWVNLPSPAQVQQSNGPQIVNGGGNKYAVPDCVLHHYACNK
jgi:hypothetical protein